MLSIGCADDDGSTTPLPTPTPSETHEAPSPGHGATDGPDITPVSADVLDLAVALPKFTLFGQNSEDLVTGGTSLALGDFNDDGQPDLLTGAPQADGPDGERPDSGEAYVIFGPLDGQIDLSEEEPDIVIYGAAPGDGLGNSVFAGDLNDDGVDDIMIGAPGVTAGFDPRTDQGRLYVFYGGDGLDEGEGFDLVEDMFDFTVTGAEGFSRLSTDIDLGDVNGDERTDLIVSAPFAGRTPGSPPGSERTGVGEVYVIFGTGDELRGEKNIAAGDYDVLLSGEIEFGQFGNSFAVGDFNTDGYDDIVVGAHRTEASNARPSGGAAYLFLGRDDMPRRLSIEDGAQGVSMVGTGPGAAFGFPITAGDFNGDGVDDFAIGAQTETIDNVATAGALRIFLGRDSFPATIDLSTDEGADVVVNATQAGALFPSAITAGDLNGDDVDDLAIATILGGTDQGRSAGGLVYILMGSSQLPPVMRLTDEILQPPLLGPVAGAHLGAAMAHGEIDSDNTGLALLAPGTGPSQERSNTGAVFVVRVDLE